MTTQEISASTITKVVVHPLVLRNIDDNHNSIGNSNTRVIGVLLGTTISPGVVSVTNSYAVPFEEEIGGPVEAWQFDESHHKTMFHMCKDLNHDEKVLGWYSTSYGLKERDFNIHSNILIDYVSNPVWVVIERGCPPMAYHAVETRLMGDFVPVSTEIDHPPIPEKSVLVTEMSPGGDNGLVDFIEDYYQYVKDCVRIGVSGYDTSIDAVDLVGHLEKHFDSCGSLEDIIVPTHPVTNAIIGSSTTVVLSGEGAADKALALNGSDVGGWRVSVTILPPEVDEMNTDMTAREFALGYAAAEDAYLN